MPDLIERSMDTRLFDSSPNHTHPSIGNLLTYCRAQFSGTVSVVLWAARIFVSRHGIKHGVKFLIHTALWPQVTINWLQFIDSRSRLRRLARTHVDIVRKIHRPYLSVDITPRRRQQMLRENYVFVGESSCQDRLWLALRNELPGVSCGSRGELKLYLRSSMFFREGEFEICLENAGALRIYTLTFSVCIQRGEPALYIGGLQGPAPGNREQVVAATASLGRLPPKLFMGRVIVTLAEILEIPRVYGIDDAVHPLRSWRYRNRRSLFKAHYADTWVALGGMRLIEGVWELPTAEYAAAARGVDQSMVQKRKSAIVNDVALKLRDLLYPATATRAVHT